MDALKRAISMLMISILLISVINVVDTKELPSDRKGKPLIGIAMCSLLTERWYKDQEALTEELGRLGADVIVQNANNQQELQNQQIESLVEMGVDVLIVIPVSSSGCRRAVAKAKQAGVQVIAYERLVLQTDIDLYISFENVNLGRQMGQGLLNYMDEGSVLLINGDEEDQNSMLYRTGYMEVLQPYIDAGKIHVAGEVWAENWTKEVAYDMVDELLEKGERIDGIIAENDSLAEMAIQALSERDVIDQTIVVGQDGDLGAYQRIAFGVQAVTIHKAYTDLARRAALAAYQLAEGEHVLSNGAVDNGYREVPCYYLSTELITKDNIQSAIIDEGVYSEEEIYRNIGWLYE